MIGIKTAINKAAKVIDPPPKTTVNRWSKKGYVSNMIEFANYGAAGGRVGQYPERLPAEIITTVRLKEKYRLSQIGQARQYLADKNLLEEKAGSGSELEAELVFKTLDYNSKIEEGREKISQLAEQGAEPDEIQKAVRELNDQMQLHEVIEDYIREYLKAVDDLENKNLSKAN